MLLCREVCDSHGAAAVQAGGHKHGTPEDVQPRRERGVGGEKYSK